MGQAHSERDPAGGFGAPQAGTPEHPYLANRTLAVASVFLAWSIENGYRSAELGNPARGHRDGGIKRYSEPKRVSYLADAQIKALETAITETAGDPIVSAALRFALFSGWRRGEVLRLRWQDVDLERGVAHFDSKGADLAR